MPGGNRYDSVQDPYPRLRPHFYPVTGTEVNKCKYYGQGITIGVETRSGRRKRLAEEKKKMMEIVEEE
jgi:hypothetical protein